MFTARIHIRSTRQPATLDLVAQGGKDCRPLTGKILRFGAFCGLLALGLPVMAAAQATSTMQVSARVVPAAAAWTGLSEAGLAVRQGVRLQAGQSLVRANGVVQTRAQVLRSDDRSLLLVTVQHPRN